jgi:hypothetical protein
VCGFEIWMMKFCIYLGLNETLDTKSIYKLNVSYLIKLFSNYLKNNDSNVLLELYLDFEDGSLFSDSNDEYSIIVDLKKVCLKKVKISFII